MVNPLEIIRRYLRNFKIDCEIVFYFSKSNVKYLLFHDNFEVFQSFINTINNSILSAFFKKMLSIFYLKLANGTELKCESRSLPNNWRIAVIYFWLAKALFSFIYLSPVFATCHHHFIFLFIFFNQSQKGITFWIQKSNIQVSLLKSIICQWV